MSSIEFASGKWATACLLLFTILSSCTAQPPTVVELSEHMRFTRRSDSTLLEFPSYLVEIRHTDPFGITQLRLQDDTRLNLADGTLPLADWEWLWWTRLGQTQRRKLLQTDWGKPFIEAGEDWIRLHFTRHMKDHDIIVNVDMDFYDNLRFGVTYQVTNVGTQAVLAPYVMLGFPGFGNQRQTSLL
ncbi:MAG: hypothetical protein HOB49_08795, partial [Gemmatimonadetes bacterium]|nr:hypothetical protein [Gemmatimonadota bacterium]